MTDLSRLRRLFASTPVRQALILTTVFAAINAAALGGSYLKLRQDMIDGLRADLARQVEDLDVNATPRAMAAIVAAKAEAVDPRDMAILFQGSDGTRTGNARAIRQGNRLHLMPLDSRPLAQDYIRDVRQISGGVVLVAVSIDPIEELRDTFGELFVLTLFPTVILSLLVAGLLARRAARRVDRIEATLSRLSDGDYDARVKTGDGSEDDLDRIATSLNHMAERQQQTLEALRQVSADIAHDLRTPLQRLSARLEHLSAQLPPESESADLAQQAQEEAQRAVSIFRSLLQIARIEGGEGEMQWEDIDLRDIAGQVFELYQVVAEDSGHMLRYVPNSAPCPAFCNRDLITQALVNLVENALRHTPEDTDIEISVHPGEVTVADNGPGIPANARNKVTRRLFRLEQSRTTPGNGLGLALVEAIAQAHGTTLKLSATEEASQKGLRASLTLRQHR